jgi:hypothetical protein
MQRSAVYAMTVLLCACTPREARVPEDALTRCLGAGARVTESGVGLLRRGASIDSLRATCPIVLETTVPYPGDAEPETQLLIVLGTVLGAESLVVIPLAGRVSRIDVRTPGLATAEGIRVGTRFSDLRSLPGVTLSAGPTHVWARVPDLCGVIVALAEREGGEYGPVPDLRLEAAWLDTATVREVSIGPCVRPG